MTITHEAPLPSAASVQKLMAQLGVADAALSGGNLPVRSPINGAQIAQVKTHPKQDAGRAIEAAYAAFKIWRKVPAPKRGELVRHFAEELRVRKELLGRLITIETGKILEEGLGEVQEMIDICGFAAGLSRQLYGRTMPSERPGHRMMEIWHPLGVTGIITAFNFPAAVWAWNAALALVCGNTLVWKPSEKTPLCALACQALLARAAAGMDGVPQNLSTVLLGGPELAETLADHPLVPLVSATGSARMGRALAPRIAARFGRAILELGGNNGAILTPSADFNLAASSILFAAAGTAGQRCTSLRRLFVHESRYEEFLARLKATYANLSIGNPLEKETLVGPLIDGAAYEAMQTALKEACLEGAKIAGGERLLEDIWPCAYFVQPAIAEMPGQSALVARETFAPILYVMRYRDLEAAISAHNAVPQGLASSIFTNDLREAGLFTSSLGSDCGIVNVNAGPSGAEIGGAFGGEKETGGGREAGSDAWKYYMRRATSTVNFSKELPLAQGIRFKRPAV
ncbi:MAG: aldehyde dehydrogenase family protein [Methylocapsa sp.]|nr:aldehyde dehydrogenase family protein [Methylocapsa sp.]